MKPASLGLLLASMLTLGCAMGGGMPGKTQLEIREFQTRAYDTNDVKMVMKALLNVLQDDGFIVKNANVELGLISATKEVDVESKAEAFFAALMLGYNARWNKNSIIECSGNVSEFGAQTRVRMVFQVKVMNNKGEVVQVRQVDDEKYYQEFFAKVDKGIFIQKEKL